MSFHTNFSHSKPTSLAIITPIFFKLNQKLQIKNFTRNDFKFANAKVQYPLINTTLHKNLKNETIAF